MGLDIFFAEDIRNALLAANEASGATAFVGARVGGNVKLLRAYREGYKAALVTVALAFGLAPQVIRPGGLGTPGRRDLATIVTKASDVDRV